MSRYSIKWKKHTLNFRFKAGTSRGTLEQKTSWYIFIKDLEEGFTGIGEAGPLKGLSTDDRDDFEEQVSYWCSYIEKHLNLRDGGNPFQKIPSDLPAIKMGFEMAWLDLRQGGSRIIFDNDYTRGEYVIPINGLVWMGEKDFMVRQVEEKLHQGFTCIKMKIGAIDFDKEIEILQSIRENHSSDQVILRVDANGAFNPDEAMSKLKELDKLDIHSIEQPIQPGSPKDMNRLCRESPVPIALDEELIGVYGNDKEYLLKSIQPQYIILKPTLLGGFTETREWINLAEAAGIGWWITSALESNIGLNAICQFTSQFENDLHQGLGTGQLYKNNFNSPLEADSGIIRYRQDVEWDLEQL